MGKLNALAIARATKRGLYPDGDGLYLQIGSHPDVRSWIYRYRIDGKVRYLGLGSANAIGLKRARELVTEPRRLRAEGIDPLETKRAKKNDAKIAAARAMSFKDVAEDYIRAHEPDWSNAVHRAQWRSTMATFVYPVIGSIPVSAIDTALVLKVLQPIWHSRIETAVRVRGRIESVLDAAAVGLRDGTNPAMWKGHLDKLLAKPNQVRKVEHLAALPYRELPAFLKQLRTRQGLGAMALEFTILTAARTGEVLGATWSEIDLDNRIWLIPGARMKAGKEHRVPLNTRAVEILGGLHAARSSSFVFPGKPDSGLAKSTMLKVLELMGRRDLTVHGFRSSFRDWCAERTNYPREICEEALAHSSGSAVELSYRRTDYFAQRGKLMQDWSDYCEQPAAADKVVPIRK
jgi:integrase